MSAADKIHDLEDLVEIVASHRRAGRSIVFSNGAFDLLHVGHIRALEEAATHGGVLVVAVNDDASVRASKGPGRPVVPAAERAEVVAALQCVDYVTVFSDRTVDRLLEQLEPTVHAKGRDYTPDTIPERATSERIGIEIAIVGDAKVHSSTQLLAQAAGTGETVDRIVPVTLRDARGVALRPARRTLERNGWLDLTRLATTDEGALVHQRRNRTVRRIEIDGQPVYVKATRPLEAKRSPLVEHHNHVILRAAGFRAPEPWLALEGVVEGQRTGVLVTREAPGLPLDQYLALGSKELAARELDAAARGIGAALRALHTARLFHPDLQAWHLFVEGDASGGRRTITFLDLMRLERGGTRIRRAKAARGLAALALSIQKTVPNRFLLAALRAYLGGSLQNARPWIRAIERHMARLETRGTFRYMER
jgi:rfaE bifunctional protein nucleotidyltransferase chain/domain